MSTIPAFDSSLDGADRFWAAVNARRAAFFGAQKIMSEPELETYKEIIFGTVEGPEFKGSKCWLWTGKINDYGYGYLKNRTVFGRMVHRVVYQLVFGVVPKRMHVDHLCRVKICCNPLHGEPVTPRENYLRGVGVAAVNASKDTCPRGHVYTGTNNRGDRLCLECYAGTARNYRSNKTGRPSLGARDARTTCPAGHPYDLVNAKGHRRCSVCRRASCARSAARKEAMKTPPEWAIGLPLSVEAGTSHSYGLAK